MKAWIRCTTRTGRLAVTFGVVLCLLCSPFQTNAGAQDALRSGETGTFDQRLARAFSEIERLGISGVVAISHKRDAPIERAFGAARNLGVEPGMTQVDINSITKTVTAIMALKLIEQGKIALETRLGEIFKNVPADKRDITVQQLLTHSAGFTESIGADDERIGRDDFLARAFRRRLISPPGREHHYSNVGYSILAAIIEIRSGKSYEAFLRDDILQGLGLNDTGYMGVYAPERSLRSGEGQTIEQASWGGHEPFWNLIGNGGLISTARDFIRLRQALASGRVLPPSLVVASQVEHIAEDETAESHYGYGLVVQDDPTVGRFYWHDGGNDIFSTKWVDYADQGDVLFTAAADGRSGGAVEMMSVLQKHLYGAISE